MYSLFPEEKLRLEDERTGHGILWTPGERQAHRASGMYTEMHERIFTKKKKKKEYSPYVDVSTRERVFVLFLLSA